MAGATNLEKAKGGCGYWPGLPNGKGTIKDNTGKEVLAAGVTADDKWKGEVNFYVEGVDGKVPSGK